MIKLYFFAIKYSGKNGSIKRITIKIKNISMITPIDLVKDTPLRNNRVKAILDLLASKVLFEAQ